MKKLCYRGTHQYSFRSGEWGEVINIKGFKGVGRWCYVVQYKDGVIDYCAVVDKNNYELIEVEDD